MNSHLQQSLDAFLQLLAEAQACHQRRLLLITGERRWGRDLLSSLLSEPQAEQQLGRRHWLSDQPVETEPCLPAAKSRQLLGQEFDCVVFDAFAGLDPDAIGAIGGTVCAGGVMVLLAPELDHWCSFLDPDYQRLLVHPFRQEQLSHRFLSHVVNSLQSAQGLLHIAESDESVSVQAVIDAVEVLTETEVPPEYCATHDQGRAVAAIEKVLTGHRRRPLLISADRGRGKSSALGIASARLLRLRPLNIVVTAPRLDSVRPLFSHAARCLGLDESSVAGGVLEYGEGSLRFVAPDELCRLCPELDLLLIDEAAAIPLPMLASLLAQYSRLVFATTVHGYEGTGRGFALQFRKLLSAQTPQWQALELLDPVRWGQGDPLERWIFDALVLDASLSDLDDSPLQIALDSVSCEVLDREQLITQPKLLRELFSLLVLAHYQTSPADLRNLLDGPNIRIWVARDEAGGRVLATALVTDEGGFDRPLAAAVWRGERRLRGHLLAQSLAAHAGVLRAPTYRYQRIMRIAVHPAYQRRGVGQQLLAAVESAAGASAVDVLGSSFGASADVLAFWRSCGLHPVRLGVTRDACSGSHSALVLKPLSERGERLELDLRFRFLQQLPKQLSHRFQALEPELVAALMLGGDFFHTVELDDQDWLDVDAFSRGYRLLEVCDVALCKLICCFFGQLELQQWLTLRQRDLLVSLLLQHQPLARVVKTLGFSGKKALLLELREVIGQIAGQQLSKSSILLH